MKIQEMIKNMKSNGIYFKSDIKRNLKKYGNFSKEEINDALMEKTE